MKANSKKVADPQALRKAAIVVAALDPTEADHLLDRMPAEQASLVRRMLVDLGDVQETEESVVLREFLMVRRSAPAVAARRETPPVQEDSDQAASLRARTSTDSFGFLRDAAGEQITPFLADEHPQTIALVLSHLPHEQSSRVLDQLPPQVQADVVRRLVELDDAHPEVLLEVERGLHSRFSEQHRRQSRLKSGLARVAEILKAATPTTKRGILLNLARHNQELAGHLDGSHFELADLDSLDPSSLITLLNVAGKDLANLALAQAPEGLAGRLASRLPPELARAFFASPAAIGPVRLADMEEASRQLLNLLRQLVLEGRVQRPASAVVATVG